MQALLCLRCEQWRTIFVLRGTVYLDTRPGAAMEAASARLEPSRKVIPPVALLLPGQVVCEGRAAVHGAGTAAALQLRQPAVLGGEGDGVRAAEGVLRQAPALPGATGPHGHHGQPDPVPSDVPPRVRKTHIHRQMATF